MFKKSQNRGTNSQQCTPTKSQELSIQYEKAIHEIKTKRDKIIDDLDRIDEKILELDKEIRSSVKSGKQKWAKIKMVEMKTYQKQIEQFQGKYNVLTTIMIQLETQASDSDFVNTFTQATELMKSQEDTNDKISDALQDWKDQQALQGETDELWKQMNSLGIEDSVLDAELAKYDKRTNAINQSKN